MASTQASRRILAAAGLLLAAATILGALAAHALQTRLPPERLGIFDTAVRYQFYHALGLLAIGLAARAGPGPLLGRAAALVVAGIVLFSGSLYALALGAPRGIGIVTPIGGLCLIAAWILFAVGALRGG